MTVARRDAERRNGASVATLKARNCVTVARRDSRCAPSPRGISERPIRARVATSRPRIYVTVARRDSRFAPSSRETARNNFAQIRSNPPDPADPADPPETQHPVQNRPWVPHAGGQDYGSLHKLPQTIWQRLFCFLVQLYPNCPPTTIGKCRRKQKNNYFFKNNMSFSRAIFP